MEKKTGLVSMAHITWIDSVTELGKVRMGDTIHIRFRFRNNSNNALIITSAETSCSCTQIVYPHQPIPAGSESMIDAFFDTNKSVTGFVKKSILVTANTSPEKKLLNYSAEITGHKVLKQ